MVKKLTGPPTLKRLAWTVLNSLHGDHRCPDASHSSLFAFRICMYWVFPHTLWYLWRHAIRLVIRSAPMLFSPLTRLPLNLEGSGFSEGCRPYGAQWICFGAAWLTHPDKTQNNWGSWSTVDKHTGLDAASLKSCLIYGGKSTLKSLSRIWISRRFFIFFKNCICIIFVPLTLIYRTLLLVKMDTSETHINSSTVSGLYNNFSSVDSRIVTGLRKRHQWNSVLLRVSSDKTNTSWRLFFLWLM